MKLKSFNQLNGGPHWVFEHNGHELSVICTKYSYGGENGLFEVQPSWKGISFVDGWLDFAGVQKWIVKLSKMKKKEGKA